MSGARGDVAQISRDAAVAVRTDVTIDVQRSRAEDGVKHAEQFDRGWLRLGDSTPLWGQS